MIDDDVGQRKFVLCMRSHLDKFERLYYQDKENGNALFTPCLCILVAYFRTLINHTSLRTVNIILSMKASICVSQL
jgi:hypothetical protein